MAVYLSPRFNEQQTDANGNPYSGGKLYTYAAGSSTLLTSYTSSTGGTPQSNPIILNSRGQVDNDIWLTGGRSYKFALYDANNVLIRTEDNVSGVNDTSITVDQWSASNLAPTYVSATSFTLAGDQTSAFHIGRRLKFTVTAGTVYGTIVASAYAALTTVTVVMDTGQVLDSGLSSVSYGILTAINPSIPQIADNVSAYNLADSALGFALINGTFVSSVNANALTIAIKTKAGVDPSTLDPVLVIFRNATDATGDYTVLSITAATSLVVSSGSTLGSSNGLATRYWIVGFNDAGTFRLGIVNCRTTTGIYPLSDDIQASSTAEGGAGAADSAGVIYTGTAVTTKPMRILGYIEATEATAGTWATAPSKIQLFGMGMKKPGDMVQFIANETGTSATGTTLTPADNTIPQITEGNEYISQAITRISVINPLYVEAEGNYASTVAGQRITQHLHYDAVANAVSVAMMFSDNAAGGASRRLHNKTLQQFGTGATTTIRLRAGQNIAGTLTFNGEAGAQLFGGAYNSYIQISEIMS